MWRKITFISLIIVLGLQSCYLTSKIPDEDPVISMKKTSCMGDCPVYEISIYSNRTVLLKAEENLELEGTYKSKLSKENYEELVTAFENSNFFSFKNEYTSRIFKDLPTTWIFYSTSDRQKKIKDYYGAPEELKKLEIMVASLIDSLEWKKVK